MSIATIYLQSVTTRLLYYKDLGDKTLKKITEEELHYQPNEASNSIAITVQHLAGNMLSRWTDFLTTDGEKEWRNRDTEFEEQHLTKQQLIALWEKGWFCFMTSLHHLTEQDLLKTIYIRLEGISVIDAINRQLMHYAYHIGQIVYVGRMIKNADWVSLSIPKNGSMAFNQQMKDKDGS